MHTHIGWRKHLPLQAFYLLATSSGRPNRELASGVCLGLCAATLQSLGLPILASCMVVLALPGIVRRSWREACVHPLRVFGGALLSILPFIVYLGVVGALDEMWYAMFEWVFNHYSEGQKDAVTQGYGAYLNTFLMLHRSVGQPWRGLAMIGLQFVKLLPVLAICGMIVSTLQVIVNRWRRSVDFVYLMVGTAAIAGTAPLLLESLVSIWCISPSSVVLGFAARPLLFNRLWPGNLGFVL